MITFLNSSSFGDKGFNSIFNLLYLLNQPLSLWDLAGAALILSATALISTEDRMRRRLSKGEGDKTHTRQSP